ncbi:hypothetical protein ABIB34_000562 [Rhodococcus sp. UYP5]
MGVPSFAGIRTTPSSSYYTGGVTNQPLAAGPIDKAALPRDTSGKVDKLQLRQRG